MSYDLTFVSRSELPPGVVVAAVHKWAGKNPNLIVDADVTGGQIGYENPDTLVHACFDLAFAKDADESPTLEGFSNTGCSANFNYLRPAFFALELTPLATSLAETMGALVYDPQDDTVLEPHEFANEGSYRRH